MDYEILDEVKTLRGILMYLAVYYDDDDDVLEYITRFSREGYIHIGYNIGNKVFTKEAVYKGIYSDNYKYQNIIEILFRKN